MVIAAREAELAIDVTQTLHEMRTRLQKVTTLAGTLVRSKAVRARHGATPILLMWLIGWCSQRQI